MGSSASRIDGRLTKPARDRHPLLLTAGKLGREVFHAVSQPHQLQRLPGALAAFFLADLCVERGQFDIFQRRGARQQVESLENEADLAIANRRQLFLAQLGNRDSFKQIASGSGLVQTAQDVHERGFAAATGAHDRDELALLDAYIYAAQRVNFGFAQVVILVHVLYQNDGVDGRLRAWIAVADCGIVAVIFVYRTASAADLRPGPGLGPRRNWPPCRR